MKKIIFMILFFYNIVVFAEFVPQNLTTLDFDNLQFTLSKQEQKQQTVANPNIKVVEKIKYIPVYIPIKIPVYQPVYIPKYITIK